MKTRKALDSLSQTGGTRTSLCTFLSFLEITSVVEAAHFKQVTGLFLTLRLILPRARNVQKIFK